MAAIPASIMGWKKLSSPLAPKQCYIHTIQVREESTQTIVTQGEWWVRPGLKESHGYYYGIIRFYAENGEKNKEIHLDRAVSYKTVLHDDFVQNTVIYSTSTSGDELSDKFVIRYASPQLVTGQSNKTIMFVTPEGVLLSGLNDRPRIICDNTSMSPD
jgi:hypothetical protein